MPLELAPLLLLATAAAVALVACWLRIPHTVGLDLAGLARGADFRRSMRTIVSLAVPGVLAAIGATSVLTPPSSRGGER